MTKTLLLLRHAKSSWKDEQLADHDRPLNQRGKRDAPRAGQRLVERRQLPDLILSSTAKRARKTAAKVAHQSGYQGVLQLHGELYLAPPAAYLEALSQLPDSIQRVLVVGHNPGMEELIEQLTGYQQAFPTCALAEIELNLARWSDVDGTTTGQLVSLWQPKTGELEL